MQYARVVRGVGRVTRALGAEQPHTGLRETGGLEDGNPSSADSANLDLLRSTAVILVLVNHLLLFLGVTYEGEFLRPLGRWGCCCSSFTAPSC
jgi:hypothetical protein